MTRTYYDIIRIYPSIYCVLPSEIAKLTSSRETAREILKKEKWLKPTAHTTRWRQSDLTSFNPTPTHVSNPSNTKDIGCPIAQPTNTNTGNKHNET